VVALKVLGNDRPFALGQAMITGDELLSATRQYSSFSSNGSSPTFPAFSTSENESPSLQKLQMAGVTIWKNIHSYRDVFWNRYQSDKFNEEGCQQST